MKHMGLSRIIRIWILSLKAALMQRMAYPFNFVFMCLGSFVQVFFSVVFIDIIFGKIDNIAGWGYSEVLLVVATYMIIEGLMWGTCAYLAGIVRNIREGTMDMMLVKPVDTQILLSIWRGDPEDWLRVVVALFVLHKAVVGLGLSGLDLAINGFFYIIFVLNAFLIVYGMNLVIKSIAFWTVESSALWNVSEMITKSSQYPTDIFSNKLMHLIFSTALPLAFIATVPAVIFSRGLDWKLLVESTVLAAVFLFISRKFFHFALKNYSSISS